MSDEFLVEPVQRSRLYQQVVVQLCELIQQAQIRPGDRLPPERELAEQFGVGRSSIREALRALEVAGLVDSRHGSGVYVRDGALDAAMAPLPLAFLASNDVIGDLWEMRAVIEPELAARAALRASDAEVAELVAIMDRQRAALADPRGDDAFLAADRAFHTTIAQASRNAVALRIIHLLNELLLESKRHYMARRDRLRLAYGRHQAVLAAIQARDPRLARDAMADHLVEVEEQILGEFFRERAVGRPARARVGKRAPVLAAGDGVEGGS